VFPYPQNKPASAKDAGVQPKEQYLPVSIIEDGVLLRENLHRAGKDETWVKMTLQQYSAEISDTLLLTVDPGGVLWMGKEP